MHSFQVADVKVFCREINFLRTNEDLGEQTYKVIWSRKLVSLLRNFLSKYCRDEIKSRGPLWRRKICHRRRTKGLFWIFIMRYFSAEKLNWYNLETAKNENGSSFRAQSSYFSRLRWIRWMKMKKLRRTHLFFGRDNYSRLTVHFVMLKTDWKIKSEYTLKRTKTRGFPIRVIRVTSALDSCGPTDRSSFGFSTSKIEWNQK